MQSVSEMEIRRFKIRLLWLLQIESSNLLFFQLILSPHSYFDWNIKQNKKTLKTRVRMSKEKTIQWK